MAVVKHTEETKRKISESRKGLTAGAKHHNWKGDEVGYASLHRWLSYNHPKTGVCEFCKVRTKTQYANKSLEYKRDIHDYYELCASCHKLLDMRRSEAPEPLIVREVKLCPMCYETKSKLEFGRNRQRIDGLQSYCLPCYRDYRANGFKGVSKHSKKVEERIKKGIKLCPRCKSEKTLAEFGNNKSHKDGKQRYCLPCYREYTNNYASNHR